MEQSSENGFKENTRKYFVKIFRHKKDYMYEIFRKLWLRCDWIHAHPPTILILPCKTLINISIRGFQIYNLVFQNSLECKFEVLTTVRALHYKPRILDHKIEEFPF